MGNALFYHLTRQPVDVTLSMLLEKSLDRGWRVVVRGGDPDRLAWLDDRLWAGPDDGFLPHGLAGGPHDAAQPVLLTTALEMPNDPACIMAVDGAPISPEEVAQLERVCILFDGHDGAAVQAAREQWIALTGAGVKAQYWSEESGRWAMKAEN